MMLRMKREIMKPMSKSMNNELFRSKNCLFCFVCGIIKKSIYTRRDFDCWWWGMERVWTEEEKERIIIKEGVNMNVGFEKEEPSQGSKGCVFKGKRSRKEKEERTKWREKRRVVEPKFLLLRFDLFGVFIYFSFLGCFILYTLKIAFFCLFVCYWVYKWILEIWWDLWIFGDIIWNRSYLLAMTLLSMIVPLLCSCCEWFVIRF